MRTGKVWGFPTLAPQSYPSSNLQNKPPVSRPFELGRFAFEDTGALEDRQLHTKQQDRVHIHALPAHTKVQMGGR